MLLFETIDTQRQLRKSKNCQNRGLFVTSWIIYRRDRSDVLVYF